MKRVFNRQMTLFLYMMLLLPAFLYGQAVHYSPESAGYNTHSTSFEIIGKHLGQRLIYTKHYDNHLITFYDRTMKPVDTVTLSLPDEVKNVHFIDLHAGFIMLYQYEHKRDIVCEAVLLDGKGQKKKKPVIIDKLVHPYRVVNDVSYTNVVSKDKSRILIYKLTKQPDDRFLTLSTFLLDSNLSLLCKGKSVLSRKEEDGGPVQVILSNRGGLYLVYGNRGFNYLSYFESLVIYYKPACKNKLITHAVFPKSHLPTAHPLLSINGVTHTLWLNTFNFDDKQRHIVSLATRQLSMDSLRVLQESVQKFEPETRKELAEKRSRRKSVFDYYVPLKVIFNRSGEGLLVAEKHLTDADDHLLYGDVGFFSLDSSGLLRQVQQIRKNPDRYSPAQLGSYLMVNRGRALHFLLNRSHKVTRFLSNRIYLLRDYRLPGNNKLQLMPVMGNMDNGYQWLPALGKQISSTEVIIPCLDGGNLLFGSIRY